MDKVKYLTSRSGSEELRISQVEDLCIAVHKAVSDIINYIEFSHKHYGSVT